MKCFIPLCLLSVVLSEKCNIQNVRAIVNESYKISRNVTSDPLVVKIDDLKGNYDFIILLNSETTMLCKNLMEKLQNVDYLYSKLLNLEKIEPDAFKNSRFKWIQIEDTQLKTLQSKSFNEMNEISEINLSGNRINSIEKGSFRKLPKLEILHLKQNKLTTVLNSWFIECPNLWKIDLSFNNIETIPAQTFNFLTVSKGHIIYLSYNKITTVEIDAFSSKDIVKLKLDGNRLPYIYKEVFKGIKSGGTLDLSNNRFKCLPNDHKDLRKLFLEVLYNDNPFKKYCDFKNNQ